MTATLAIKLEPPRLEDRGPLLIAGLSERYSADVSHQIPAQWQRFGPLVGKIPERSGRATYGVVAGAPERAGGIDYLTGVEVSGIGGLPAEFRHIRIPAQRYAVFTHRDHASSVGQTCEAIFQNGLADAGYEAARAPFFERYGETFDPRTGRGEIEVWIPVKP